jgi:cytoskeletal protein RodZ
MVAADSLTTKLLAQAKKRSLLPLLVVLFIASYCLMTALIVFQDSTIRSQRSLILTLFSDSQQLWAIKGKAVIDKELAHLHEKAPSSQEKAPSTQAPTTRTPMTRTPMTQAPSVTAPLTQAPTQSPSTQAVPQHRNQNHVAKAKPKIQLPPQPAADPGDQRRVLFTI